MATPTPVAPPPTTTMSQGLGCARTRRHISSRVMMEKSGKVFSNDSHAFDDQSGQGCAEQGTDDWYRRVLPIGAAFAAKRKNGMHNPGSKVSRRINGISSRAAQA